MRFQTLFSNVTIFQVLTQSKNFEFKTFHLITRYYENIMSNIPRFLNPLGHIKCFKKEMNVENHWKKLQNLSLYNTNLKFRYIITKISLTQYFIITLNHLDPTVGKLKGILHKKQTNFLRFRTLFF